MKARPIGLGSQGPTSGTSRQRLRELLGTTRQEAETHDGEGKRVVPREPGALVDPTERSQPVGQREPSVAEVPKARDGVVALDQPLAALPCAGHLDLLARQVEVERSGNVDAVRADEEPERRADTGVHIQELVLPVAGVIPVAHVDDALVPDRLHEVLGRHLDDLVGGADA